MVYSACLYEILKTLKWKHQTQHFRANYMRIGTGFGAFEDFKVYTGHDKYALVNTEGEWAVAPKFLVNSIRGIVYERIRGPFIFRDGFDETDEAQYLVSMMIYPELTSAAEKKVALIRKQYANWIDEDKEVIEILRRYIKWL